MAHVSVKRALGHPIETVWAVIGDFADVSWFQGLTRHEIEGEGPGMVRTMYTGDAPPVRERLDSVDPGSHMLRYSITEGNPLPVSGYRATMKLVPAGGDACELEWSCECEPEGVPEADAVAAVEAMYGVLIGWLRDALGAG